MAFQKITESESLYDNLDQMSVRELLEGINNEDRKVAIAVGREIPKIEKLVTRIVERMRRGGRLFYIGAGTSGRLGVLDASRDPSHVWYAEYLGDRFDRRRRPGAPESSGVGGRRSG